MEEFYKELHRIAKFYGIESYHILIHRGGQFYSHMGQVYENIQKLQEGEGDNQR